MVRVSEWGNLTSEFLSSPRGAVGTQGLDSDLCRGQGCYVESNLTEMV